VYSYTGQLPGPKFTTIRGNSRDRSLQLYGELPGPKSTTIRGTPRTEVYNYTGHLPGPKFTTIRGNSRDRSLQLYGELPGPKSTTIRGISKDRSLQLYGASPRTEVYNYTGHLQGPKSATIRGNSRDRSTALALEKNFLRENLHFLSHICKSSVRTLIRRDVVSDTCVTPDRILVFVVTGWLFSPCIVSRVPRPDVTRGLWKWPVWLFSDRSFLSREHVQAMKQVTGW
jgi:hypothetical protein